MNYKQLEKEFDKKWKLLEFEAPKEMFNGVNLVAGTKESIKNLLKAIINQVIDEMIGEEKDGKDCGEDRESWYETGLIIGHNRKVQELKEYKKKFNK